MRTEKSAAFRTKWSAAITQARALLEGSPTPTLSAEDQTRYDTLMNEGLDARRAAEREEMLADQERDIDAPMPEPVVVRSMPAAGQEPDIVDESEMSAARRARRTPEYRNAWRRFLSGRDPKGTEARALQMDSDTAGGYTVASESFMATLIKNVDDLVHIRQRASTFTLETAESLGVPTLAADPDDFDWTTELATGSEDNAMAFGKREFRPNPLAKRIKISKKLLRASTIDPEGLVRQRLAYKAGITQEKAYLTGHGAGRPLGVFVASNDGIPTSRDITAGTSTAITGDGLHDTNYGLKAQYRAAPELAWLLHRDAIKQVVKLKSTDNQYLFQPGLTATTPDRLLGHEIMESEFAPNTFTTGLYVGMLAAWSWYWIVDALDMTVQRLVELYAETNQDGFIARLESDGMPVLPEAFARMKLA